MRAAGGVVWRRGDDGLEVVLVHRLVYLDWTLPKGKVEPGERDEETAVREVEEEAGVRCDLGPELPSTSYRDKAARPKVVRYWAMTVASGEVGPHHEIDDARWVGADEARRILTHAHDVGVLDALVALLA